MNFEKHENYGFTRKFIKLLRSFLTDREQCVSVNDLEMERLSIKTGVPKVLFWAHSFFIYLSMIYLHDISDEGKTTMFVDDDTRIFQSGKGTQFLLMSEMKPV